MHYPDLKLTSSSEKHGFWSKESATDRGSWSRMKINSSVAKGHSSGTEAESSDTKRDFSDMKAKSNDMKAKRTDSMSLPVRPTITIVRLASTIDKNVVLIYSSLILRLIHPKAGPTTPKK